MTLNVKARVKNPENYLLAIFWQKIPKTEVLPYNSHSKSISTIKCFNYVTFN